MKLRGMVLYLMLLPFLLACEDEPVVSAPPGGGQGGSNPISSPSPVNTPSPGGTTKNRTPGTRESKSVPETANLSYPRSFLRLEAGKAMASLTPDSDVAFEKYYTYIRLPEGLKLNERTGVIAGTPTPGTLSKDVTIFADRKGNTSTFRIEFEITASVAAKPPIVAPPTVPKEVDPEIAYPETYVEIKAQLPMKPLVPKITGKFDQLSTLYELPEGLSLNPKTGAIEGTPRKIGERVVTVIIGLSGSHSQSRVRISIVSPFAGGSGYSGNPFLIQTPEQLQLISSFPNSSFALANDINLAGKEFTPLILQDGSFNGREFAIRNLTIRKPPAGVPGVGLFAKISGTSAVENLWIVYPKIEAPDTDYVGTLAGRVAGESVAVTNVVALQVQVLGRKFVGGLVGSFEGGDWQRNVFDQVLIEGKTRVFGTDKKEIQLESDVKGVDSVGGVTGYASSVQIKRASVRLMRLAGKNRVGGITGHNEAFIKYSNAYLLSMYGPGKTMGGIAGLNGMKQAETVGYDVGIEACAANIEHGFIAPEEKESYGLLVGINRNGNVTRSFASGNIFVLESKDGSVGTKYEVDTGNFIRSYWASPLVGTVEEAGRVSSDSYGLTSEDLGGYAKSAWGEGLWYYGDANAYPMLRWEYELRLRIKRALE